LKKIVGSLFSWFYWLGLVITQASYRFLPLRMKKVGARVISIGNITCGGTGKTPLVAKIARELAEGGRKVAVLTRGYGEDEVQELKKKLPGVPVIVGRDRVRTAREAIDKFGAQLLILDDGFQHLRLRRDLDVVNINAAAPFGPGGLLPAGTLREPLGHLGRADVFVLTKSDIGSKNLPWIREKLLKVKPDALIFEAVHKPMRFADPIKGRSVGLQDVRGRRVATISGIGDPFSFEKSVENLGCEIHLAARFDDHHRFTRRDLEDFTAQCRALGLRDVVTTEKDFFRLEPFLKQLPDLCTLNFLILEIEIEIHDEEAFLRRCINP